ncbi:MAG: glycosyltransferase 87 family protein, partial [Chloroflexota bacterium]
MHPGTIWSNRLKAVAFAFGLVLSLFSALNWWSIYDRHAPPCSPECAADFVTFYAAAKLLVDRPAALYDLDLQYAYQKQIAPNQKVLPFVYPPVTAMLMAPLAWLSFSNAFLAITLLNGALLWLSLRNLIHHLSLSQDQSHWLILFSLCNYGVQQVFYQAQVSVIILFLLTTYTLSQKQGNDERAGAWAGLLCVKPQFFPMPSFYLFL